ncbi:hypothetical protein HDU93_000274 [Gonapodya sp. JEL0774]|nr:hypothetical protein HDU93_000274 [Gonapodya sp. JEL0774]
MSYALSTGGPPMVMWSFWPVTLLVCTVALSMAELCSAMPTMGGLYNFAARLGGPKWGPYAAWNTAWFNYISNVAGLANAAQGSAYLLVVIRQLNSDWVPEIEEMRHVEYGLYFGVVSVVALINIFGEDYLPSVAQFASYIIFLGTMVIAIYPLAYQGSANLASGEFVFITWQNGTGADSNVLVALIGLLPAAWNIVGFDASSHIAEETSDSTTSASTSLVFTVIAGAVGGFFLWVCQFFLITDLDAVLNGDYDPYVQIWMNTVGPGPTTAFLTIMCFSFIMTASASVVVTSRMFFSLVRDKALPFSDFWYYISPTLHSPVRAISLTAFLTYVLGLPILFSDVVFPALTSVSTICFYVSTVIPTLLRITVAKDTFKRGPWHLGEWTYASGWTAVIFVAFMTVAFVLPTEYPVEPDLSNFNFSPLIFGILLVFINVWWVLFTRHTYHGPVRNISDEELAKLEDKLTTSQTSANIGVAA